MSLSVLLAGFVVIVVYYALRKRRDSVRIKDIHKKYVLITGCDTGFGYAAAKRFDSLGCNVIAGCLTKEGQERLTEECSDRLLAVRLDVCSDDSVEAMAEQIKQHIAHTTGLWGLINNAGAMGPVGPLEWYSGQDLLDLLNLNVCGLMRVTNAVLPLLKQGADGGRVVNTASVLGHLSLPYIAPYSISKHASLAYSNALRRELRCFGITVHTIEPGGHKTPFLAAATLKQKATDQFNNLSPELRSQYGEKYLTKMLWVGTDVARAVAADTPDGVVQAYEDAVFSQHPRLYYVVGRDALLYLGTAYLPAALSDWLFSLSFLQPRPAQRPSSAVTIG